MVEMSGPQSPTRSAANLAEAMRLRDAGQNGQTVRTGAAVSSGENTAPPAAGPAVQDGTAFVQGDSFFTSGGLSRSTADLASLLDGMGASIATLSGQAATLTQITGFIGAAEALAYGALATKDPAARGTLAGQYNEILDSIASAGKQVNSQSALLASQIDPLLETGGPQGGDWLSGLDPAGFPQSLGLLPSGSAEGGTLSVELAAPGSTLSGTERIVPSANFAAGQTLTVSDASGHTVGLVQISTTTTVNDLISNINSLGGSIRVSLAGGALVLSSSEPFTVSGGSEGGAFANAPVGTSAADWATDAGLSATLGALASARTAINTASTAIGTRLQALQGRQAFTRAFASSLQGAGADYQASDLTEEGASLAALQLRQELASSLFSFSSQAQKSVLTLL